MQEKKMCSVVYLHLFGFINGCFRFRDRFLKVNNNLVFKMFVTNIITTKIKTSDM